MRTSNKILLGFFALVLVTITIIIIVLGRNMNAAPDKETDDNSEKAKKQIDLPHFNKIEIAGRINVHYMQDTFQKIVIRGDSSLLEQLKTEVHYDKLFIRSKIQFRSRQRIDVYVTNDSINEIESNDGGSFKTTGKIQVYQMDCTGEAGGTFQIDGDFTNLNLELNAGSFGDFSGKCRNMKIRSSAGGVINADNMTAVVAIVSSSAGAVVNINVTGELSIDASAGSVVKCQGNPQIKAINISSGARFVK